MHLTETIAAGPSAAAQALFEAPVFALYDSSTPQAGGKKISEEKKNGLAEGWLMGTDRKGERIAMVNFDRVAAYRFANDKLEEIYPPKKIDRVRGLPISALHPSEDLFWFADKVLEFSTGKEVASLDLQNNQVRNFIVVGGSRSKSGVTSYGGIENFTICIKKHIPRGNGILNCLICVEI